MTPKIAKTVPGFSPVPRGEIALSIHDYDPNPSAVAEALDRAFAASATSRRPLMLGGGKWVTAKPGGHRVRSHTGLYGDPSSGSTLEFTHPDGHLDISDTAGTSMRHVYKTQLRDITVDGGGVAKVPLRGVRCEEMAWRNIRIQGHTESAADLEETSLFKTDGLEVAGPVLAPDKDQPPAMRLFGACGQLELTSPNIWLSSGIHIKGTGVSKLLINGGAWFERCSDVVVVDAPGSVSLRCQIETTHGVSTLAAARLLRTVGPAAGETAPRRLTGRMVIGDGLTWQAEQTSEPLFDLRGAPTDAFVLDLGDGSVYTTSAPQLVAVHPDQPWYYLSVYRGTLYRHASGELLPAERVYPPGGFVTGGVWARPYVMSSVGSPEGQHAAPPGVIYRASDTGQVWAKRHGHGKTGWLPISSGTDITILPAGAAATLAQEALLLGGDVTLPAASGCRGKVYRVRYTGTSGTATVTPAVDGAPLALEPGQYATLVSDGNSWRRFG